MNNGYLSKRQVYETVRSQLENEMASFTPHWRDLTDYFMPRRGKFFISDSNRGDKRNQKIIDSTGTMAVRTLRSGMMAGVTSPARPWFRLGFADQNIADIPAVKAWLRTVEDRMRTVFAQSNLYKALPIVFGDMGTFGTAAMYVEEDFDKAMRFTTFPIGSYSLANDEKLRVRVFKREFQMTVRQVVEKFARMENGNIDWANLSEHVKNQWDLKQYETWVDIIHIIKPNPDHRPDMVDSKFKKFVSCYYERGTSQQGGENSVDKFLRESGYDYFPVLAPRWEVSSEDAYGTNCPGMTALGDVKQLQLGEKRGSQALEKMINPAMVGPTSLKNAKASILPGDITYVDDKDVGRSSFRPVHEVNPGILVPLEQKQAQIRSRINEAFFVDLFLMLANTDRRQITATEIMERKEEKLLALGPVLEQINEDLLDPLIDIAFMIMDKQGLVPEAPEEIQGQDIKVEYVSIMAQAQKLAGIGNIERFVGFVGQLAGIKPAALDNLDEDETVASYGDLMGVPLNLIKSRDKVAEQRQMAAEQMAQEQDMQTAAASVDAAKNLSQTSMDSSNALGQLLA